MTETSIWSIGSDQIQRWKNPLQKFWDERAIMKWLGLHFKFAWAQLFKANDVFN